MSTALNERDNVLLHSPLDLRKDETEQTDAIRVILVDDDDDYREAATAELEYFGFAVVGYPDGDAMLDYLEKNPDATDVIVLDWRLQAGTGIDYLPLLHDRGINLPVVFLTGVPSATYENAALDRGAVDFVDKARGIPILVKRLRLIVQMNRLLPTHPNHEVLEHGQIVLRPDISRAYWAGRDIDLTVTEFKIVYLLVSRAGEYVTYRSIYDCVHHAGFMAGNGSNGFRTNVRSSIRRIRNKFRDLDPGFGEIENYAAFGYRWRAAASAVGTTAA